MTSDKTRQQIRIIMADAFKVPLDELPGQPTPENIKGWDSLGHFMLIEKIEEHFSMEIDHAKVVELLSEDAIVLHLTGQNLDNSTG